MKTIVGPEALPGATLAKPVAQVCFGEYIVLHLADGTAHIQSSSPFDPHTRGAIPDDMSLPTRLRLGLITQAEYDAGMGDEPLRLARHAVELRQIELEGARFQLEQAQEKLDALGGAEFPRALCPGCGQELMPSEQSGIGRCRGCAPAGI